VSKRGGKEKGGKEKKEETIRIRNFQEDQYLERSTRNVCASGHQAFPVFARINCRAILMSEGADDGHSD